MSFDFSIKLIITIAIGSLLSYIVIRLFVSLCEYIYDKLNKDESLDDLITELQDWCEEDERILFHTVVDDDHAYMITRTQIIDVTDIYKTTDSK